METVRQTYPKRAVVKCKAKIRLLADPVFGLMAQPFDEALFLDIARTLLRVDRATALYQPCATKQAAREIENQFAVQVVETYKRIKSQQQDPIVQRLNALL